MKLKCNYNFNCNDGQLDVKVEVDEDGEVSLVYETKTKMLLITFDLVDFMAVLVNNPIALKVVRDYE